MLWNQQIYRWMCIAVLFLSIAEIAFHRDYSSRYQPVTRTCMDILFDSLPCRGSKPRPQLTTGRKTIENLMSGFRFDV